MKKKKRKGNKSTRKQLALFGAIAAKLVFMLLSELKTKARGVIARGVLPYISYIAQRVWF